MARTGALKGGLAFSSGICDPPDPSRVDRSEDAVSEKERMQSRANVKMKWSGILGAVIAAGIAAACAGGCMRMQTQRTTLEHKSQVVTPEGGAVATAGVEQNDQR